MRSLFDAHVHIIDPRFPLIANQGFVPPAYTIADYRAAMSGYDVQGGAVVAGSFQGTGTTWLTTALQELGPQWVGVAQLNVATADETLLDLDAAGVRALRINLHRGEVAQTRAQFELAVRAWDLLGWHCELYVDCAKLDGLEKQIAALPCAIIDHLGLTAAGNETLLHLVENGAKVKATGFGRLDFDAAQVLQQVSAIDPTALLFGSDLPGTRAPRAFDARDIELIVTTLGEELAQRALHGNGRALYGRRPRR